MKKNTNKYIDSLTSSTTTITTADEILNETIATLEWSNLCLEGTCPAFVQASKTATESFTFCGEYIRYTADAAKCASKLDQQVLKVKALKEQYEKELREEKRLGLECDQFFKKARELKLKVSDSFAAASKAWKSDDW